LQNSSDGGVHQLAAQLQQQAAIAEPAPHPPAYEPPASSASYPPPPPIQQPVYYPPPPQVPYTPPVVQQIPVVPTPVVEKAILAEPPAPVVPAPIEKTIIPVLPPPPEWTRRYPKDGQLKPALDKALFSAIDNNKDSIVEQLLDRGADPNSDHALERAAYKNNVNSTRHLLDFGADVNIKTHNNRTALGTACDHGHLAVANLLLERGADPNIPGPELPIVFGIRHPKVVERLIQSNVDVNVPGLLQACCWHQNYESLAMLLDVGSSINDLGKENRTALYVAADHNREKAVRILLERGADPNVPGKNQPIVAALPHPKILQLLVSAGADLHVNDLLQAAVWHKQLESVKILLDAGIDINNLNTDQKTALVVAADHNRLEIANYLLSRGADPNFPGKYQPLYVGVMHPEIVKALLGAGASIHTNDLLQAAVWHKQPDSVTALLDAGLDINNVNKDQKTALVVAADHNRVDIAKLLLAKGADPNFPCKYQPLYVGIMHPNIVRELVNAGADVHQHDLLQCAAWHRQPDSMNMLLDAGVDINNINNDKKTALGVAADHGREKEVEALLARGADPNVPGPHQPLSMAIQHPNILKMLVASGANPHIHDALQSATWHRRPESIKILLDAGVDINNLNNDNRTALFVASEHGREEEAKVLLSRGADPKFPGPNQPVVAAIHHPKILDILIKSGADPNYGDAFHQAVWHKKTDSVKVLLDAGADVNRLNHESRTGLWYACERGSGDIVNMLLKHGANTEMADKEGKTPLDMAAGGGHDEIVMSLLDHTP
jgi:ankyrin repeat protein